jgi:hypothetical protein
MLPGLNKLGAGFEAVLTKKFVAAKIIVTNSDTRSQVGKTPKDIKLW